jgi:hypothetical protein
MDSLLPFQIACTSCDALGVVFDYSDHAPLSTPLKCCRCSATRGTLGGCVNSPYRAAAISLRLMFQARLPETAFRVPTKYLRSKGSRFAIE